jgi:hypothetical protein
MHFYSDLSSLDSLDKGCHFVKYNKDKNIIQCECTHLTDFTIIYEQKLNKGESPQNISDSSPYSPAGIAW